MEFFKRPRDKLALSLSLMLRQKVLRRCSDLRFIVVGLCWLNELVSVPSSSGTSWGRGAATWAGDQEARV